MNAPSAAFAAVLPAVSPLAWARHLSAAPQVSSDSGHWDGALLRRWTGIDPDIVQPALDRHYITMHLGGAKRLTRRGEGRCHEADVEAGALSIVPAGSAYAWATRGPVDFVHLYLPPETVARVGHEEFGRDRASVADRFAIDDPLLRALLATMLGEVQRPGFGSRLYLDTLLHALMLALLRGHAGIGALSRAQHSLPPVRLRRVLDHVEANFGSNIGLAEMAAVAACSPFHFSRAFAAATGKPPYAYLTAHRIAVARHRLATGTDSVAVIAAGCGFRSAEQFARMFRQLTGQSPRSFRASQS